MSVLWWIQVILTFAEFAGAFWCIWALTGVSVRLDFGKAVLAIGFCSVIALTVYQRSIYMYSRWYMLLCIGYCGLLGIICLKGNRKNIWLVFWIYFETLYCLDLFLYIYASVLWEEKDFFLETHINLSIERIEIYVIARFILIVIIICIYEKKDVIGNYIVMNKWIVIVIPIVEHISLFLCDRILLPGKEESAVRHWKVFLMIYPFLSIIIIIFLLFQKYKLLSQRLEYQNKIYLQQLETRLKNTHEKERIYHDLKNHLIVMKKVVQDGKTDQIEAYINKLVNPIIMEDIEIKTGKSILDYLIQEKELEAIQDDIQVVVDCERFQLEISNNELADWCILLGNLWDNAIEECKRMDQLGWIHFSLKQVGNAVIILMQNSCHTNLNSKWLKTIKQDKKRHGIGMRSIWYIVNRYHGTLVWDCENCVFRIRITILL